MKTVFTLNTNRRLSSCLESTVSASHTTELQFPLLALHLCDTCLAVQANKMYCNILQTPKKFLVSKHQQDMVVTV